MISGPPLIDMADSKIIEIIRKNAPHTAHSYDSLMAELDRRAAQRQARASFRLSVVSTVIATIAVVVTAATLIIRGV